MFAQSGQSLLEVITTAAVGILVVSALTFATIFSLRNAQFAKNSAQATKLAQEGIEKVRSSRDRGLVINSFIGSNGVNVTSWSGTSSTLCAGTTDIKEDSIWCSQISGNGLCDDPSLGRCYFSIDPTTGILANRGFAFVPTSSVSLPTLTEKIISDNQEFYRIILLSDDEDYQTQKKITVSVRWTDFAGPHESTLTTILRRI